MEARFLSAALAVASVLSLGASYRTQNFLVTAPTPQAAQQIGESAEAYRRDLAVEWLGRELPPWRDPCPITAHIGPQVGAGGATSFMFDQNMPFGWTMTIQGSHERILDSVLPHEITHTIFATHFGRPLPRWADEGACTTVEHISEKTKQHHLLINFLTTGRGIAFNKMFAMKEYPPDILPLYSQGYSLARFLIAQEGKRTFIEYVGDGMSWNNWTAATQKHYGYKSLSELQVTWLDWVRRGSPPIEPKDTLIAMQDAGVSTGVNNNAPVAPATALASDAPAGRTMAAAGGTAGSWYARQRDLARDPVGQSASPNASGLGVQAGSADARPEPLIRSSVTRQQDIGTPQPTVIQQSAPPNPSFAPLRTVPIPITPTGPYASLPQANQRY
jgi:hypothetical protein